MIHAILQGKAGTVDIDGDSQSWREVFKKREDILTSMFWSTINYLPKDQFNHFMGLILRSPTFSHGNPSSLVFWPRFVYIDFDCERVAEPDLLLEYKNFDIMIEVKPPFGRGQYFDQWDREILAYRQEGRDKDLIFLAIGNVPPESNQWLRTIEGKYDNVRCYSMTWAWVMECLSTMDGFNTQNSIVSDCCLMLSYYGVKKPTPSWESLRQVIHQPLLRNDFADLPKYD